MYAAEGFITFVEVKLRSGLSRILLPKSMLANRVLKDGSTPRRHVCGALPPTRGYLKEIACRNSTGIFEDAGNEH